MSEEPPKLPEDLQQYDALDAQVTSNGQRRIYGVDEEGKKTQLKGDDVLAAYGYTDADLPGAIPDSSPEAEDPATSAPEASADKEPDVYDEYTEAVRSGEARDKTFSQWVLDTEKSKAAKWYTDTRSHGEAAIARSENGPDTDEKGSGDIEPGLLIDEENQERLNAREGRANPTEDDTDYYAWLKRSSGRSEEDAPAEGGETPTEGPEGPGGPGEPNPPEEPGPETPTPEEPETPDDTEVIPGIEDLDDPEYQALREEMEEARSEFAALAAKRRGVSTFSIRASNKRLEKARQRYESLRDQAGAYVAGHLERIGRSPEEIKQLATAARALESMFLTKNVMDLQLASAEGKRLKPFYDWWARQGGHKFFSKAGLKGNLKKGVAMAAIGFVPGVGLGIAGAAVLGPVVGGVLGASLAARVGRGLMGARINKNAEAPEVARVQNETQQASDLERFDANPDDLGTSAVTAGVMDLTDRSVGRNRRRNAQAAAVAAIAGVAGGILGHQIHDIFSPPKGPIDKIPTTGDPGPPKPPTEIPNFGDLDARYPWTHMADKVGAEAATNHILDLAQKGQAIGWTVEGNGASGGQGAILRIITPTGAILEGNEQINLGLDLIEELTKNSGTTIPVTS